jgi:cellulase/cellobiase CelA1
MKKPNREISALYLELASDCFAKAATAEDRVTAEGLRRMAERYMIQAVALNPTIGHRRPDAERLTARAVSD